MALNIIRCVPFMLKAPDQTSRRLDAVCKFCGFARFSAIQAGGKRACAQPLMRTLQYGLAARFARCSHLQR